MAGSDARQRYLGGLLIVVVVGFVSWQFWKWWTLPPAVEFDNLKYIQLLTTAVSSRSPAMVDKVESAVQQSATSGKMSEQEQRHFQDLIDLARAGKWEEADRRCFAFAEAQLSRTRNQPPSDKHSHDHAEHSHDHGHGHGHNHNQKHATPSSK